MKIYKQAVIELDFPERPELHSIVTFTLTDSKAFQYGNQTILLVDQVCEMPDFNEQKAIDTRYSDISNFDKLCLDWLKHEKLKHTAKVLISSKKLW